MIQYSTDYVFSLFSKVYLLKENLNAFYIAYFCRLFFAGSFDHILYGLKKSPQAAELFPAARQSLLLRMGRTEIRISSDPFHRGQLDLWTCRFP